MKKIILTLVFALGITTLAYGYHGGRHNGGYGRGHDGYDRDGRGYDRNYDRDYDRDYDRGYNGRHRGGYGRHGDYRYNDRNYSYNNSRYSQEEVAKMDAIYQKYDVQIEKLRTDMFAKNSEIRVAYSQTTPDQAKIASLLDERAKISSEMQKIRMSIDLEIRAIFGNN